MCARPCAKRSNTTEMLTLSSWLPQYHSIIKPPGRRREQTGFEDGGRAVHCGQFDPRGAAKQTPVLSFNAHKLLLC